MKASERQKNLDEESKIRQRRERLEAWKREQQQSQHHKLSVPPSQLSSNKQQSFLSGSFGKVSNDQEDESADSSDNRLRKLKVFDDSILDLGPKMPDWDVDAETLHPGVTDDQEDSVPPDNSKSADGMIVDNVEDDPLELFMAKVEHESTQDAAISEQVVDTGSTSLEGAGDILPQEIDGEGITRFDAENSEDDDMYDEEEGAGSFELVAKSNKKDLERTNHALVEYEAFRKNFYVEPAEQCSWLESELEARRAADEIKVKGLNCPKPVDTWLQFGLPQPVLEVIRKVLRYQKPSPIQSQSIPAISSGRDIIGIAKTGSGKTMAFLLPMFRHIKAQRPIGPQEGPIALIMTPTRELALQIHRECKVFLKVLSLRAACCYGGSNLKDQIAEMKKGVEIAICTPGRMIDLLAANSGRVTNLKRVTYLVLDEADRMFDMGFEPQVMKIINNIRPDRQTVLFSATFPRKMEALARAVLTKPLEITVGGKSTVCSDVTQVVEVFSVEDAKFLRLLEILGNATADSGHGKILIFVDKQEAADRLLNLLYRRGYLCHSLHGGKDQADRYSTLQDFKSGVISVLIATSVAARGLDVKDLDLVINYSPPNHMEDYVHRVGRTGRAGIKGTAYTFLLEDEERYAADIVKALRMSNVPVPEDLQALAESFSSKVKEGKAQFSGSGYGGKGLDELDKGRDIIKEIQKRTIGLDFADEEKDEAAQDETYLDSKNAGGDQDASEAEKAASSLGLSSFGAKAASAKDGGDYGIQTSAMGTTEAGLAKANAIAKAREVAKQINLALGVDPSLCDTLLEKQPKLLEPKAFYYELEINDYPQKARWRVTNKEQIGHITEISGAAITTRGLYYPPGKVPLPGGERKLYLFLEGESQFVIERAKSEISKVLAEAGAEVAAQSAYGSSSSGRYTVV